MKAKLEAKKAANGGAPLTLSALTGGSEKPSPIDDKKAAIAQKKAVYTHQKKKKKTFSERRSTNFLDYTQTHDPS